MKLKSFVKYIAISGLSILLGFMISVLFNYFSILFSSQSFGFVNTFIFAYASTFFMLHWTILAAIAIFVLLLKKFYKDQDGDFWRFILFLIIIAIVYSLVRGQIIRGKDTTTEKVNQVQDNSSLYYLSTSIVAYTEDNNKLLPKGITDEYKTISSDGADICSYILPKYMVTLPISQKIYDESIGNRVRNCTGPYNTGFQVKYENGELHLKDANYSEDELYSKIKLDAIIAPE